MTHAEKKEVQDYLDIVYRRINKAKNAIKYMNYGTALDILSEAFPKLKLKVDE